MVGPEASIKGFPDTKRELKLRAYMQHQMRRRKQQQGSFREDLIAKQVRAQALDADGLGANLASITDQLYVLGL